MIVIPTIVEIALMGVANRGVPNKERVVLRPTEPVQLGEFALISVARNVDNNGVPLVDGFFWFGELQVSPPSWVYVYTGPGYYTASHISGSDVPVHVYHWGRKTTMFSDAVHPALIRLGGVGFGSTGLIEPPMTVEELSELLRTISAATPPPAKPVLPPAPRPSLPKK